MGIIDIHGHITHPELFKLLPMPPSLGDIEAMLEQKSAAGIELTIVGSPVGFGTMVPIEGRDNFDQTVDQLREFHDWLGSTVQEHAGRLAAYVYTNPFGGEQLLAEAARTVKEGPFVGLIVNTSVRGKYLDSEEADDFFAMVDELDVPVVLHPPAEPVGAASVTNFAIVERLLRFNEVAVSLAALVLGGRLERHPGLKLIGVTSGGPIGLVARRLSAAGGMGRPAGNGTPGAADAPPRPDPVELLRRVYVDTASSNTAHQLANLDLMGAGKMMFGTDSPPLATPLQAAIELIEELPVSAGDKRRIFEGNARELFALEAL